MNLKSSSSFQGLLSKVNALKLFVKNVNKNSSRINFINEYVNSKVQSVDEYNKLLLKRIESLEAEVSKLKEINSSK